MRSSPEQSAAALVAVLEAQEKALRWVGLRARDVYGARLGPVESVLVDREAGHVVWLVVRLGRISGVHVALPPVDVTQGGDTLHVPWERVKLAKAPPIPNAGGLGTRLERELCTFYGIDPAVRAAGVSAWERRATASRLLTPGVWDPAPQAGVPR